MQYNVLVLYLAAAANGFLSYVIIRGKREFINTIFSLFALSAAMWAFFLALFIATEDLASALIYANLYYFFAAAIPVLLLYFSIYFRRERPLSLKHATFIVPWIILC